MVRNVGASAELRKRQIVDSAMHCFQHKGYVHTTMEDIASACGMSKASITWYYPSKKAVLSDLFQSWMEETLVNVARETAVCSSYRDKLIRMGEFFIESLMKNLELYSALVVFWSMASEDESMRDQIMELYREYDGIVCSFLYQGEMQGEFRVPDKKVFSVLLIAVIEGLIVRQVLSRDLDLMRIRKEMRSMLAGFLNTALGENARNHFECGRQE
ncbi:MAG: TetR/AcrR family transcriptional regulator [Desulfomonilia bacterium]|nr:TetR/AcrR family transcriptional regulator [Desulfomonilia bacterium]